MFDDSCSWHLIAIGVEAVLEADDVRVLLLHQHAHDLQLPVLEALVLKNLSRQVQYNKKCKSTNIHHTAVRPTTKIQQEAERHIKSSYRPVCEVL